MRKSTIFISTILTTFSLVMLYSVVSAYRNTTTTTEASALAMDTATAEPTSEPTSEPTVTPTIVTPEGAAQLAAQVVGNSNLLSAESSVINNLAAYKITFTNNDVVYVGLDGQILAVQIAPVVVNVAAAPATTRNRNRNNADNNSAASNNGGTNEDHEDPEGHDD